MKEYSFECTKCSKRIKPTFIMEDSTVICSKCGHHNKLNRDDKGKINVHKDKISE